MFRPYVFFIIDFLWKYYLITTLCIAPLAEIAGKYIRSMRAGFMVYEPRKRGITGMMNLCAPCESERQYITTLSLWHSRYDSPADHSLLSSSYEHPAGIGTSMRTYSAEAFKSTFTVNDACLPTVNSGTAVETVA